MGKVCIIGLDGATLELLDLWVASGDMPHLKALMERGSRGRLTSTFPPVTAPAWTSMTTGVGPGTHGVFDWVRWNSRETQGTVVSSADVAFPRIWDVAGVRGLRAGAVGVPLTFPAAAVHGFLVAGMMSPRPHPALAFPAALTAELMEQGLDLFEHAVPSEPPVRCARGLLESHGRFDRAVRYLVQRFQPEFFMCVIRETDRMQHKLYDYCHKLPEARRAAVRSVVREFFRSVDATIGFLIGFFGAATNYFVASDHGVRRLEAVCRLNSALADAGLLVVHRRGVAWGEAKRRLLRFGGRLAGRLGLLGLVRGALRQIVGSARADLIALDAFEQLAGAVDWAHTRAVVKSRSDYGAWVNLKGREPYGIIEPGAGYEQARNELIAALKSLRDPSTGGSLVTHLWRKEEVLSGPRLREAPDVFFRLREGRVGRDLALTGPLLRTIPGGAGVHCLTGMIVACGPHIRAGAETNAHITDVAPTVLYAMGLPVPEHMEGQVLTGLFTDEFRSGHPVRRSAAHVGPPAVASMAAGLSAEDAEAVKARLRDLGYL